MAIRVPNSNTTTASTTGWDTVTNTPTLHATTNTLVNATARFTATFTAPNTTDSCKGVLLYFTSGGTNTSVTVTLQQATVDTAAAVTVANANLPTTQGWFYFVFPTPFVFTTTAAGTYRFKVQAAGVTANGNAASDSGAALYAFLAVDSRSGALGATDTLKIQNENGTGTRTITVSGTSTSIGTYGDTVLAVQRTLGNTIDISSGGLLTWDTTASATLTQKGNTLVNTGGELRMGSVGTPMPSAFTATYIIDSALSGDHGIKAFVGGKLNFNGASKTYYYTKYASGSGIAADPLIMTDPVAWSVGDEICITATSNNATNYNEVEFKFIKTVNSSTSYVLSDTVGGAESAFTNTHTTAAYITNLNRNVIVTPKVITLATYVNTSDTDTTSANTSLTWARFEYSGVASPTGKEGVRVGASGGKYNLNYCVAYKPVYAGFLVATTKAVQTYTGLIAVGGTSTTAASGLLYASSANNITFSRCFAISGNRIGFYGTSSFNITLNNCVMNANNRAGNVLTANAGSLALLNAGATLNNCELNATRNMGLSLSNSALSTVFNNCNIGKDGSNTVDINLIQDSYDGAFFNNCYFGSATLINNYLGMSAGSLISFQTRQNTTNLNAWYTAFGSASATGSGLTDTFVRTPSSLALKIAPEDNTTGFEWDEFIPVDAHNTATFQAYFGANTALAGDLTATARVELWLPGSTSADTSATIPLVDVSGGAAWRSVSISAQYTGTIPGMAVMKVFVLTATAGAYLYVDDTYNAGNTVISKDPTTGLDVWVNGLLSPVLSPSTITQGYLAAAVWDEPATNHKTAATMGALENGALSTGKFIALK